MADLWIRDLDERKIAKLEERAARNNRSLEEEMRLIIEHAASMNLVDSRSAAAALREKLRDRPSSDSATLVAEDRRR